MNRWRTRPCSAVSVAGIMLVVGCQAPQRDTSARQIPRITKLCQKATATRVHRFRKPLRDEHARVLRQLVIECDRLAADVGTWEGSAELTATNAEQQGAIRTDIRSLGTALTELRAAAGKGDTRSVRSAHSAALTAYARIGDVMNPPGSPSQ